MTSPLPPLSAGKTMKSSKLTNLIADNFLAYYNAHTFHLNVTGPNFPQYHSLFEEVYDKLWDWHDTLSEQLRQGGEKYPFHLADITKTSVLTDDASGISRTDEMLYILKKDLSALLTCASALYETADPALETVLGDYCADVKKLIWKIDATAGK